MNEGGSKLFFSNIKESSIVSIANDVELNNGIFVSFVNNSGKKFNVQVSEIIVFLEVLLKHNQDISHDIISNELFVSAETPWSYQEKPYRNLVDKYFPLNVFSTINPLIGSQTNGIYRAINSFICFLVGKNIDTNKYDFDSKTVALAIENIKNFSTVIKSSNIKPAFILGPFESVKTAALESLYFCYENNKSQFMDNVEISEHKGCIKGGGLYLWASQKGLDEKECDLRVFKDKPFDFNGVLYFLSDQWTNESANGRSIKNLNTFVSRYGYEIVVYQGKYYLQKIATIKSSVIPQDFQIIGFNECSTRAKLKFPEKLPYRFISSLLTKPFVILTGLSGSGKTKLAEAFSLWISEDPDTQIRMISVGADWTNREPLLGYPNALEPGRYVKPDSGALDLILNAINNPELPHFLVLDEMNMSHVERYFADFLSAMESSRRRISIHPDTDDWKDDDGNWKDGVPDIIELPKNLFIVGTVNIDETTYMFSPKVLDRAQVIEFRVSKDEMTEFIVSPAPVDMMELKGFGASMGADFVTKAQAMHVAPENLPDTILPFFDELQSAGAEFGYRTASEISRFVSICTGIADGVMQPADVIDAAIMQKLLPKVHGSRNKIEKILRLLGQRCLADPTNEPFKKNESGAATYPVSYEKIERMHRRVIADGFTSYAEA